MLFKRGGKKALNIIFCFLEQAYLFPFPVPMERAQCKGMLACEKSAAPVALVHILASSTSCTLHEQ